MQCIFGGCIESVVPEISCLDACDVCWDTQKHSFYFSSIAFCLVLYAAIMSVIV